MNKIQKSIPFVLNEDLCVILTPERLLTFWSNANGLVGIIDEDHELIQYCYKLGKIDRTILFDIMMQISPTNKTADYNLFKKQSVSFTVYETKFEFAPFIQRPEDRL